MKKSKRMRIIMLSVCLLLSGIIISIPAAADVQAYSQLTQPIELSGNIEEFDNTTYGYSWDGMTRTLTLHDGFSMELNKSTNTGVKNAIELNPLDDVSPTIVLEGTATVKTDQSGIRSLGDLTIRSAEGAGGCLKVIISNNGSSGSGTGYYGIHTGNSLAGISGHITVTDNAILYVSGGDNALASDGSTSDLVITEDSVVKLENSSTKTGSGAGLNFRLKSPERVVFDNGTVSYKTENATETIGTQKSLTMLSLSIPDALRESDVVYSRTYDGSMHPLSVNINRTALNGIGVQDILITRKAVSYRESEGSDYLAGTDYRDRKITDATVQSDTFTASDANASSPKAPYVRGEYVLSYRGSEFVTFRIDPRKITVTGLSAKDKTYDGWADAEIDYSKMKLSCVNKNDSAEADLLDCDMYKLQGDIVPCAAAHFVRGAGNAESADVAYNGSGISAKVAEKTVLIDEITLSDPNYEVVQPGEQSETASQGSSAARIFPRSLSDSSITPEITHKTSATWRHEKDKEEWSAAWNKDGFTEDDFVFTLTDSSVVTAGGSGQNYELKQGGEEGGSDYDYLVDPDSTVVKDVGSYRIKITGRTGGGNYTGTRILPWKIRKAVTSVTVSKPADKMYETGTAYTAEPGSNEGGLYYVIKDTENKRTITDELPADSVTVTYKGSGGTEYAESETAPSAAGTYTATVTFAETDNYEGSLGSVTYTISPARIGMSALTVGTWDDHETTDAIWAAGSEGTEGSEPLRWNGNIQRPSIWVADSSGKITRLVRGTDYTDSGKKSALEGSRDPDDDDKETDYIITVAGLDKYKESCDIPWNIKRLESSISAAPGNDKWTKNDDGSWKVTYEPSADYPGTDYYDPRFDVTYTNEDYEQSEENILNLIRYHYTGYVGSPEELSDPANLTEDRKYDSTKAPTQAGSYEVVLTLPSTEHYDKSSTDKIRYDILPREVTISRVSRDAYPEAPEAVKVYDGTADAVLDLSKSVWVDASGTEMTELAGEKNGVKGVLADIDYSDAAKKPVNYTASFADKNVRLGAGGVENRKITISDWSFNYEKAPGMVSNYVIAEKNGYKNVAEIQGRIDPYEVEIADITAGDKEYDGTDEVKNIRVTFKEVKLAKGAAEEKIEADVSAKFIVTGTEPTAKDVLKINGSVRAKNVEVSYNGIVAGNADTDADNYTFKLKEEDKKTTAKINPKTVRVTGLTAKTKVFDNTAKAELDWRNAGLSGVFEQDTDYVELDEDTLPAEAEYDDAKIEYDDQGKLKEKTAKLFASGLKLKGSDDAEFKPARNYRVDENVTFTGVIEPMPVTGIVWTFDEDNYRKVPSAEYPESALAEGDESGCEAIVEFFEETDVNYENPVIQDDMQDDTYYVARVTGVTNRDYQPDRNDANRNYRSGSGRMAFYYDRDPDENELAVTNYDGKSFTYGTALPDVKLTHVNTQVKNKMTEEEAGALFTCRFSGKALDGELFSSEGTLETAQKPVKAGHYKVEVTLAETYHFNAGTATAEFDIDPKPLTGVVWTFDEDNLRKVPTAVFAKDAGIAYDGDECAPVVKYYEMSDASYSTPVDPYDMQDNTYYIARVTGTDNTNYIPAENDETRNYRESETVLGFYHDKELDPIGIEITNYDSTTAVTYGSSLPQVKFTHKNTYIRKLTEEQREDLVTYTYKGEDLDGNLFNSTGKAGEVRLPVKAGKYEVTVTMAETYHFRSGSASAPFVIEPKPLSGVKWTFDEDNLKKVPVAEFKEGVGLVGDDTCEPVVEFFETSDTGYRSPVRQSAMKDDTVYRARVTGTNNTNYVPGENDSTGNKDFYYDKVLDPNGIKILNYSDGEGGPLNVTYGSALPEIEVSHVNTYVKDKLNEEQAEDLFTYTYSGKDLSGNSYSSTGKADTVKAPVRAGNYEVTVTLAETYHFESGSANAEFNIVPKPLKGVDWTFDEDSLEQVPSASFRQNAGFVGSDECEPVWQYFETTDESYVRPLTQDMMEDDTVYIARVTAAGSKDYCPSDDDESRNYTFYYDEVKDKSKLAISNYKGENGSLYTVTYGETPDKPELDISNPDISKKSKAEQAAYFTYSYEGRELNGKTYSSDKVPTQAGTYTVKVTQAETYHFLETTATASFRIAPAPVKVISGVKAKNKFYNGTSVASLDFSDAVFSGAIEGEKELLEAVFKDGGSDHMRYSADFADKNVSRSEPDAEGSRTVIDKTVSINPARYSFRYTDNTPDILYNYQMAAEGNQTESAARIDPRPVKVSGIAAEDKVYDGDAAAVIDYSNVSFSNIIAGEKLKAVISGEYQISGSEKHAEDVLVNASGKAVSKKISLKIEDILAGNDDTDAANYCLAEEDQQIQTAARILPAEITSVIWTFDAVNQLPSAELSKAGGILDADRLTGGLTMKIYRKSDKEFDSPVSSKKLVLGDRYVARIENIGDTNYIVNDNMGNRKYTFTYGVTDTTKADAVRKGSLALNKGIKIKWNGNKLTVKWKAYSGADGYEVFTGIGSSEFEKAADIKGKTSFSTDKEIEKRKYSKKKYKAYVSAYVMVSGKKVYVGKSNTVSIGGGKVYNYNAKRLIIPDRTLSVEAGKKISSDAYVKMFKGKTKKLVERSGSYAGLKYWSNNTAVAKVSSKGKIKGVRKGKCTVYVMTRSGVKKTITVRVK